METEEEIVEHEQTPLAQVTRGLPVARRSGRYLRRGQGRGRGQRGQRERRGQNQEPRTRTVRRFETVTVEDTQDEVLYAEK